MEITKSDWNINGNKMTLQMSFAKVDQEKRIVSGFATMDNVDRQKDQVLSSASKDAFSKFRGNIREMHQPIAAGRMVDFVEEDFYNKDDGKTYKGIWVNAYVSRGAQDTWEKVLDGTLSGFSIGGNILDKEKVWNKDAEGQIDIIKSYELVELSLVDSPANQLANVFSYKMDDGGNRMLKGMMSETTLSNVFWCPIDEIAKEEATEKSDCLHCGNEMQNIGWIEKDSDIAEQVGTVVKKFLRSKEEAEQLEKGEGGVNMADEVVEKTVTTETLADTPAEEETNAGGEVVEPEVDPNGTQEETPAEEVVTEDGDIEKVLTEIQKSLKEGFAKSDDVEKAVEMVTTKVEDLEKSLTEKTSEFLSKVEEFEKSLAVLSGDQGAVTKRLESLEKGTAIKKSGEVETTTEETEIKKGLWSGSIL